MAEKERTNAGQDVAGPVRDPRDRQPMQIEPEPDDEQQAEPEARHRLADQRHHRQQPVDRRALVECREDAEGKGDGEREDEPDAAQRQRDRQPCRDQPGDGRVIKVGIAEVALQRAPRPVEELHRERTIEPVFLADDRNVFGGGVRAGDRGGEIAGNAGEREGDHQHGDSDEDGQREPAQRIAEHCSKRMAAAPHNQARGWAPGPHKRCAAPGAGPLDPLSAARHKGGAPGPHKRCAAPGAQPLAKRAGGGVPGVRLPRRVPRWARSRRAGPGAAARASARW